MPCYFKIVMPLAAILLLTSCQRTASSNASVDRNGVPRTADGKPDLTGVWQPGSDVPGTWEEANQGNGVPDPGTGSRARKAEPIPYQPWAAAKILEAYNRRFIDNPVARCIPQLDLGGGALYPNQFIQTPKNLVILIESRHVYRLIPLNEKHPDDLDPSYLGDSVGHWEGDTLVVDVTGFKEQMAGSEIHSDQWHIVEHFTRVDHNTINYQATLEDPKALTRPWHVTSKYMLRPGTRLQEHVCEENNQDPSNFAVMMKKGLVTRK
jgi:hypothetical protein